MPQPVPADKEKRHRRRREQLTLERLMASRDSAEYSMMASIADTISGSSGAASTTLSSPSNSGDRSSNVSPVSSGSTDSLSKAQQEKYQPPVGCCGLFALYHAAQRLSSQDPEACRPHFPDEPHSPAVVSPRASDFEVAQGLSAVDEVSKHELGFAGGQNVVRRRRKGADRKLSRYPLDRAKGGHTPHPAVMTDPDSDGGGMIIVPVEDGGFSHPTAEEQQELHRALRLQRYAAALGDLATRKPGMDDEAFRRAMRRLRRDFSDVLPKRYGEASDGVSSESDVSNIASDGEEASRVPECVPPLDLDGLELEPGYGDDDADDVSSVVTPRSASR